MRKRNEDDVINAGEEDEMTIRGYRLSCTKILLTWLGVVLSFGLLLIAMSWRRCIFLKCTHQACSLNKAEKVLLTDSYNQQFVEEVVCPVNKSLVSKQCIYFYNKRIKYIWNPQSAKFSKTGGLEVQFCSQFYSMMKGLQTTEAISRLQYYGTNSIHIEVQPICKLVLREIQSPFYIYQVFIIIIWLVQLYYQFAICIALLSVLSITATVWETRKQSKALRDTVQIDAIITVLRDGKEVKKSSEDLVPGDVILLPQSNFIMVCDAVLLTGNCVVNESMLTGESMPITKVPVASDCSGYDTTANKQSTLFSGTEVLNSRSMDESKVKAVVYRTGFSTTKGELVRAILFPKPVNFKLYSDLFKCMIIFFILGIPPVVYATIISIELDAYINDAVIIVFNVLTFLVPPSLPAIMTSINAYAQRRLRKHGIYCLNSKYINICGGLDVVCFDKTGTLTEDSLDISGVLQVENGCFPRHDTMVKDINHLPNSSLLKALATCHSLTKVDGKLLGYTIDLKIFEAIGWDLEEPIFGDQVLFERLPSRIVFPIISNLPDMRTCSIAVVRQFPFESLLRRMSVVAKSQGSDHFEVYMKGAPELVCSLSKSETVPKDFKDILEFYTRQGFRVIGVGTRNLPPEITWDEILKMPREELECQLQFQGLVVLQNRLKPETKPTLNILKKANIRTIMVTGDNLLTAITVACECGMIEEHDSVISVEANLVPSDSVTTSNYGKTHLKVHYIQAKLSGFSEKLNVIKNDMLDEICIPVRTQGRCHIAIEGATFNMIRLHNSQLLDKIVLRGTIFARMLPEHKLYLIEALQNLDHQVGMCGDGANDCGALKAAHAGISLSVAEASVASPFTSTKQNIQCIPSVIREGRAALSATFGAFRYTVCYCFVFLSAVLMLFWDGQKPADGTYVTIDIILNLIPPIVFGSTHAFHGLVKRSPTRSVISFLPLFSMFSFITIQIGVCTIAYKYCLMQSWYEPFIFDADKINIPTASHAGTAILTVNMMSYVIAAVIFSPGPPYRKSFYSNKPYCGIIIIEFFLVSYLTISPSEAFAQFVNLKPAPFIDYHLVLYALSLGNFIISYIWEVIFIQGFLSEYLVPCLRRLRGPIHKYEKLLEQMQANNKWPPVGHYEIFNIGDGYRADERNAVISWHSRWSQWIRSSKLSYMVDLKHSEQESLDQSIPEALSFITIKDERNKLGEGYSDQDYI